MESTGAASGGRLPSGTAARPTSEQSTAPAEALPARNDDAWSEPAPSPAGARTSGGVVRVATPRIGAVVRIVMVVVVCGIALYLLWRIRVVVRLVGISVFFALAIIPIVDVLTARTRVPRAVIILTVYAVLTSAVVLVGYVLVPSLVAQLRQLAHDAPRYADELRANGFFRHYDDRYHISARLVQDAHRLPQLVGHLAGPLKDVTVQAFSFIGQLTTVLALTFLLVLHGREYVGMGLSLTGARQQRYRRLLIEINRAVAKYVLGNMVISALATLATWLVLSILGVPYSLSLGLVVGFFDLIPLVGATLGAAVVAITTLAVDFPTASIVWIVFIIVWQRIEDYVAQPLVYGKTLRVNPIVTIVSVLAGASLLGVLGALLAIPTAAAIQIVLRDWWTNRDPVSRAGPPPGER